MSRVVQFSRRVLNVPQTAKSAKLPRLEEDERRLLEWFIGLPLDRWGDWMTIPEVRHATRIPYARLRVAMMRSGWLRRLDRHHGVELWHGPAWSPGERELAESLYCR